MKEAKLVRLLTKDSKGQFNPKGLNQVVREKIKVPNNVIEASRENCFSTGLIYLEIETNKK